MFLHFFFRQFSLPSHHSILSFLLLSFIHFTMGSPQLPLYLASSSFLSTPDQLIFKPTFSYSSIFSLFNCHWFLFISSSFFPNACFPVLRALSFFSHARSVLYRPDLILPFYTLTYLRFQHNHSPCNPVCPFIQVSLSLGF